MIVGVVVVVVLALLFIGELFVRSGTEYLDEPLWWHDRFTLHKELQMRRLGRRGGVDVVFIGASQMLYGVDPAIIETHTGLRCYNASIYRGLPTISEAWMHDFVLPLLRPRLVVAAATPVETNDRSPLTTRLQEYREAGVFRRSPVRRIHRWLSLRSWLALYASRLRQPRRLLAVLARGARPRAWRWHVPHEVPRVLGPLGQGEDLADRSYKVMPGMRRLVVSHVGADYDNGGEQTAAYARLVDLNASYGAATVFVAIPVPDAMLTEFFHGGRAAYAEVCEQVRTFVATLGVPFLDVSDGFEDTLFYADPMHLNGVGRERFSERVAQALVEHLPAPDGRVSAT